MQKEHQIKMVYLNNQLKRIKQELECGKQIKYELDNNATITCTLEGFGVVNPWQMEILRKAGVIVRTGNSDLQRGSYVLKKVG